MSKCNHDHELREIVAATELQVKCTGCKEVIQTRQRVLSSNIFAIGRNGNDTEVTFLDQSTKGPGLTAKYFDVPLRVHNKFMKAESKGKFFTSQFKKKFKRWEYI